VSRKYDSRIFQDRLRENVVFPWLTLPSAAQNPAGFVVRTFASTRQILAWNRCFPASGGFRICQHTEFFMSRFFPLAGMAGLLCAVLFLASAAFAATAVPESQPRASEEKKTEADTDHAKQAAIRASIKAGATPVGVEHDGTDTLGAKLAFRLKEIFNSGTLFALTDGDVPKLQILIGSVPEFPSRPGVGSLYSVIWLYSERSTVFSSYLAHDKGIITPDDLEDLAARIAARTGGIVARHSYLFTRGSTQ
jgi:hypothetical protein